MAQLNNTLLVDPTDGAQLSQIAAALDAGLRVIALALEAVAGAIRAAEAPASRRRRRRRA
jgi:hypothetical protein